VVRSPLRKGQPPLDPLLSRLLRLLLLPLFFWSLQASGKAAPVTPPETIPAAAKASPPPPPPAPSGAALLEGAEPLAIGPGSAAGPAVPGQGVVRLTPTVLGAPAPLSQPPAPSIPVAPSPAVVVPSPNRALVLDRRRRLLTVLENGQALRRFSVAVGMPGWETPVGSFTVLEKTENPVWEHPEKGTHTPAGPTNPLGSRWIGFHRDCLGRRGWDGEQILDVKGCVVAGFHGTPHRWTVGQAVSHGCVRLYDEDVRTLFDLVRLGTPVTVLP